MDSVVLLTVLQNVVPCSCSSAPIFLDVINTVRESHLYAMNPQILIPFSNQDVQVFLMLRDHLGDEVLEEAGGVLYELIEVDCVHSDDAGAVFQSWKHDHMKRYVRTRILCPTVQF
jgi:hypothetical protein